MVKMNMEQSNKRYFNLEHWQGITIYLILYDIFSIALSYFLALWIRFDCRFLEIPERFLHPYYQSILFYAGFCIIVFWILHLYQSIWRFASYDELQRVSMATIITGMLHVICMTAFVARMPISYYLFGMVIQYILTLAVRFAYRFVLLVKGQVDKEETDAVTKRVMLIGAGNAGQMILRDIKASKEVNEKVCCIIDDNRNKWNRYIDGVPVCGGREEILRCASEMKIDKIYLAIPSASASEKRDILNICKETGCELKNLPGMYQLYSGQVSVSAMKEVMVEDLLGRETVRVNMDEIFQYIKGKTLLVTGGGGSIGSELVRQVASHEPKQLIIFDVYENNAYEIQKEMERTYPELDLVTLIGTVRDFGRLMQVFEQYHPDIVYHAAAHKHVPLMEDSPNEAIKNNVIGTYQTAYAAMVNGCQRFVLISTDKAVNPTNIMGASKRLCEMVVQSFDRMIKAGTPEKLNRSFLQYESFPEHIPTEYVAVRFGNVLGSNGSVIPLFKKQIASGGPVTVTHPDIIRYFMTISEAVSLVLQAGTYAKGGEIFVLDMGEPVKIDDLARNLIKLSGYKPDVDIRIQYTGLRPGEKLYEEKLMAEEGLQKTPNQLIHIGSPIPFDTEKFLMQLEKLAEAGFENADDIREYVRQMVSGYAPV